jgi:hypothetical protein
MPSHVREERFLIQIGTTDDALRVQELLDESQVWPQRFRVQIAASETRAARQFYGATSLDVLADAAEYLLSSSLGPESSLPKIRKGN